MVNGQLLLHLINSVWPDFEVVGLFVIKLEVLEVLPIPIASRELALVGMTRDDVPGSMVVTVVIGLMATMGMPWPAVFRGVMTMGLGRDAKSE